jgi:beta-mannosidase
LRKREGEIEIIIVSDRLRSAPAELRLSLLDFNGETLWNIQRQIELHALESRSYLTFATDPILKGRDPKSVFLFAELLMNGKRVSSNTYFFEPFKNLLLPKAEVSALVVPARNGFKLTISSDKLARAVYLSAPGYKGSFRDNYFDLIPGRPIEVEFQSTEPPKLNNFRTRLKIRSLADAF